jgi:chromosome segregation ATPase
LSGILVAQTERDRRIAQLTDGLALKSAQLEQATKGKKRAELGLRELQAKLDGLQLSHDQAKANAAEEKKRAGLELRELRAKLDESLLSRNHALEQARSALQKASCAADANEQSQRELTEMRAELEARRSEPAASCLRLADTEDNCAKSKAEADTDRNQNATGLVDTDEGRIVHKLVERMQVMEAEMASLRWNEKNFETMECRNEG